MQRRSLDENKQIVAPRHQVTGLNFIEAADPICQMIEPTSTLRRDAHFDHSTHRCGGLTLTGKVEHRTPAEEDFIFFQLLQMLVNLGFGQTCHLRHLRW